MELPVDHLEQDRVAGLLPSPDPIQLIDENGAVTSGDVAGVYELPPVQTLAEAYRRMVVGRRFDAEATALTRQGRLAVYPSSKGQEACQVGGVLALAEQDWLFPTYRDTMSLVMRGVDPVDALGLLRGDWHCGYDPMKERIAPQCTPLATHAPHAAGLAYAARRRGEDAVALAFIGDGGTSEGDFHEALNFAAVFNAPAVFLVQNNRYAISVPLSRQTAAPSLAYKGIGYGIRSEQIDGNDVAAVLAVLSEAMSHARSGHGPMLIEAHTYRIEAHTNADDAGRYRDPSETAMWVPRDPISRLERYLTGVGALDDQAVRRVQDEAEAFAEELRSRMGADPAVRPEEMFSHVLAEPTAQLRAQRETVRELVMRGD
ncbi:pyruvate dehydrogenase (acetyl-transferring) E1 component subunit alpha [Phytoactinopolyspora halotolerans]|uniref:Pyruvate dehydrogenase (Acetyl-transferring) E1 component subunit alpha n=1 Tax=Phytoactinopolyspora halotolerans TaxID=1981512 RepID=A0A6L9S382_9ACTN|nr:pyruvate dehydrogenase (acetyl-transferring) E1 component subunit alpha [Phytoactinopolyspora halotolerans]NED99864.1 pyruvate dehydrogenase (acetyl-transferring) E1 component subunit alpha [Phytoactinopolyspora halotolerans]